MINVYRKFCLTVGEYIFFSCAHGTYVKIDYILGHKKKTLNKYKRTVFSNNYETKPEINNRNITGKLPNT